MLWFIPVIPALGRLRQENRAFEANLSDIARFSQNKANKEKD
jgi:hypothetical protein